jgi:hypothetical protein
MPPGGPNWEEVDKSTSRMKERERSKPRLVEMERTVERGYLPMTEEEYKCALDSAREEVRQANPKWSDREIEDEARKRADAAKAKHESSYTLRESVKYEWKKPE